MPRRTKSSSISATKCKPDPAQTNQVLKWILSGATEHDISEAIKASWPDAAARPLLVAAIEQLRDSADFDPQTVLGFCFEATRELYRRMIDIGDFAGALRAVKQLTEIAGKRPWDYSPAQEETAADESRPSRPPAQK